MKGDGSTPRAWAGGTWAAALWMPASGQHPEVSVLQADTLPTPCTAPSQTFGICGDHLGADELFTQLQCTELSLYSANYLGPGFSLIVCKAQNTFSYGTNNPSLIYIIFCIPYFLVLPASFH